MIDRPSSIPASRRRRRGRDGGKAGVSMHAYVCVLMGPEDLDVQTQTHADLWQALAQASRWALTGQRFSAVVLWRHKAVWRSHE